MILATVFGLLILGLAINNLEGYMSPKEQETEFYRRRSLPGVSVRQCSTARCFDVFLSYCGQEYGSKHEMLKRGKVVSTTYVLPSIDKT